MLSKKKRKLRERGIFLPAKYVQPSTGGKCPYCKKYVEGLEAHTKAKHRGEKFIRKRII
ncbi:MAG TPA: hypothetical protein HA282_05015 [Nanoarchaeota archaeon]|nr:hypothetical protein [Nanoarchaeota archaeon]